ncbi:hypothetical protein BDZ89DRAFT_1072852 [Hymenopellis radicata]|nr:hypothetical protein BDZ89DRAFT_1072852 [Hymenopellis radicata]
MLQSHCRSSVRVMSRRARTLVMMETVDAIRHLHSGQRGANESNPASFDVIPSCHRIKSSPKQHRQRADLHRIVNLDRPLNELPNTQTPSRAIQTRNVQ